MTTWNEDRQLAEDRAAAARAALAAPPEPEPEGGTATLTVDGPVFLLGQCYVCLLAAQGTVPPLPVEQAVTLVKGTGVCQLHLRHIANADLLAILP